MAGARPRRRFPWLRKGRTGWGWPQGASRLARCLLTLPTHAYLKEEDMARITDAFQAAAAWAAQPVQ